MGGSFSSSIRRVGPGSWLANWLDRRQPRPNSFVCGVRMLDSVTGGRIARWQYRRSAVDQLRLGDVITLYHGSTDTIRLRLDPDPYWRHGGPRQRQGLIVLAATTLESRARILIAVPPGELACFGLAGL